MATLLIQTRVEACLKKQADIFFQSIGLDTTSAIRLFLNQALIQQRIPFDIVSKEIVDRKSALDNFKAMRAALSSRKEPSLADINREIKKTRKSLKEKR